MDCRTQLIFCIIDVVLGYSIQDPDEETFASSAFSTTTSFNLGLVPPDVSRRVLSP